MRVGRFLLPLVLCAPVVQPSTAQTPQRDPQAVTVLTQSIAAMGGNVPVDSVATGSVTISVGTTTDTGTIRILTKGVNQTSEEVQTSRGVRKIVYSRGQASEVQGTVATRLNMELVVTSQCPDFPLPLLAAALNDANTALQYVGLETIGGITSHHLRFWSTFSPPISQQLNEFSRKDLWLPTGTNLPTRLSFYRHPARGNLVPNTFIQVVFSDYRTTSGVLYPFRIARSINGTHAATINIQNVSFNNGLSDTLFPIPPLPRR